MNRRFQAILLGLYRRSVAAGLWSLPGARRLFEILYLTYKRFFEARDLRALRPYVTPGSTVIDVGANIGFFALQFAKWTGPGGRVIALEPEAVNFASLRRQIARRGLDSVVDAIAAAAAETTGPQHLALNPYHPGDHRLAESGLTIDGVCLDDLIRDGGCPAVSLIKIDVQGAEMRVLAGATEILEKYRPALFVEVDDDALASMGSSARQLFADLDGRGYSIHRFADRALSPPLSPADAEMAQRASEGYLDFMFLDHGRRDN